jgi:tight adherence protein B
VAPEVFAFAAGVLAFGAVFLLAAGLAARRRSEHWLARRRAALAEQLADRAGVVRKPEGGRGLFADLEAAARRAGVDLPPGRMGLVALLGMVAGAAFAYGVTGRPEYAALGLLFGLAAPRLWLARQIEARSVLLETQLLSLFQQMASALRAGQTAPQAIQDAAASSAPPLKTVLAEVVREFNAGATLTAALEKAAEKSGSRDVKVFAAAVGLHVRTGADLAAICDRFAENIRERQVFRSLVAARSGEMRLSALGVTVIPVIFLGVFRAMSPEYVAPLFETPEGHLMLLACGAVMTLGGVVIKRMMRIDY